MAEDSVRGRDSFRETSQIRTWQYSIGALHESTKYVAPDQQNSIHIPPLDLTTSVHIRGKTGPIKMGANQKPSTITGYNRIGSSKLFSPSPLHNYGPCPCPSKYPDHLSLSPALLSFSLVSVNFSLSVYNSIETLGFWST